MVNHQHVQVFEISDFDFNFENVAERRHHLDCQDFTAALLAQKPLQHAFEAVARTVFGRDASDVQSPSFEPLMGVLLEHFRVQHLVSVSRVPSRFVDHADS